MRKEDCFYLGKITKKYSFKGELIAFLDTDEPQLYKNLKSVFVAVGNQLTSFSIQKASLHKTKLLRITFKDVATETEAEKLINCELYLPLDLLPKLSGKKFYYHEVVGFQIEDINFGKIGTLENIQENTAQALFKIQNNNKEILIPIHNDFIKEIDRLQKKIIVETPEGLIDLYLE